MDSDRDYIPDTIAAIATPPGEGGIAVIRVSGPDALSIADRIFRGPPPCLSERTAGNFVYGHVTTVDRADLDEAIVLVYRAPHSYTCEDVVEIQCHGGRAVSRRILKAVLNAGARSAEPGEFTRRAFLNGRIDLVQAEAVMDIIQARSERATRAAVEQIEGRLSASVNDVYDVLLHASAELEATLDFEDGEVPGADFRRIHGALLDARGKLERLMATWEEGHLLREGALTVIAGEPNVGKSTLLNRLLGSDRSIVTEIPGTTRDTIEETVILEGIPLRLVDTAGIRTAECPVEQIGVQRSMTYLQRADLVLYIVDGSQPLPDGERERLATLDPRRSLILLNKSDLGSRMQPQDLTPLHAIPVSLLDDTCLTDIRAAVLDRLGAHTETAPHAAINERHRHNIHSALNALNTALNLDIEDIEHNAILIVTHIRSALERLGEITGRVYSDDILDTIFSRFCIGK